MCKIYNKYYKRKFIKIVDEVVLSNYFVFQLLSKFKDLQK